MASGEHLTESDAQGWLDLDVLAADGLDLAASLVDVRAAGGERTLSRPEVVARAARAQSLVAVAAALVAAGVALGDPAGASWALALAILVGAGAAAAHLLLQHRPAYPFAALALLGSQLGVLAWALALGGARPALLAFVPALAALALRLRGRAFALGVASIALALYLVWTGLELQQGVAPALSPVGPARTLLDAALATAGLLLALAAVLSVHADERRALGLAGRRRRDAEDLLAGYTLLQTSVRRDAARLETTLRAALRGERVEPVAPHVADPALYELAELLDLATDRLQTLHRDREDRVRLEGAVRSLTRAVDQLERGTLPAWPEPSGTLVDSLEASLRRLHPHPSAAAPAQRRRRDAVPAPSASAGGAAPTRGRTTGIILSWRPSRSPVISEAAGARTGAEWRAWPPIDADDEGNAPA